MYIQSNADSVMFVGIALQGMTVERQPIGTRGTFNTSGPGRHTMRVHSMEHRQRGLALQAQKLTLNVIDRAVGNTDMVSVY